MAGNRRRHRTATNRAIGRPNMTGRWRAFLQSDRDRAAGAALSRHSAPLDSQSRRYGRMATGVSGEDCKLARKHLERGGRYRPGRPGSPALHGGRPRNRGSRPRQSLESGSRSGYRPRIDPAAAARRGRIVDRAERGARAPRRVAARAAWPVRRVLSSVKCGLRLAQGRDHIVGDGQRASLGPEFVLGEMKKNGVTRVVWLPDRESGRKATRRTTARVQRS